MTTRLRVRHTTHYAYDGPVTSSYNEARLTPPTTPTQTTLDATLRTEPRATVLRYWDYWGSQVSAFDLHAPHDSLEVVATSLVETGPPAPPEAVVGWDVLRRDAVADRHAELLMATPATRTEDSLAAAGASVAAQPDPLTGLFEAASLVHHHVDYRPGSTGVRTTAAQAWEARTGVCQDFAHITLSLLRAAGIPARYVSGYLHPAVAPVVGSTVAGESHAWVEGWVGDWVAIDPTNEAEVGERYVVVARGRDYTDVAPLRGIYAGAARSTLSVSVEITRLR